MGGLGEGGGLDNATEMNNRLLKFAKDMRRHATDAEIATWRQLRAHRFQGWKFKRQQPIGSYIVDFVCFDCRVVIEIDGGQHMDNRRYDEERTSWLETQGFRVLRFWNDDVLTRQDDVFDAIFVALCESTPSPQPLSHKGRGAKAVLPAPPALHLSPRGRGRREAPGEGA
jgi:very-short-patch-repair endonuclease